MCGFGSSCTSPVCLPAQGCLEFPIDCNDDDPFTVDTCNNNILSGEDLGCHNDGLCDDLDPCTANVYDITAGTCSNPAYTNCCTSDADCIGGDPCNMSNGPVPGTGTCPPPLVVGGCIYNATPGANNYCYVTYPSCGNHNGTCNVDNECIEGPTNCPATAGCVHQACTESGCISIGYDDNLCGVYLGYSAHCLPDECPSGIIPGCMYCFEPIYGIPGVTINPGEDGYWNPNNVFNCTCYQPSQTR